MSFETQLALQLVAGIVWLALLFSVGWDWHRRMR
jgi:hypothetical protein